MSDRPNELGHPRVRTRLLGADPVEWILGSDEPGARWLTFTAVLGLPANDLAVQEARAALLKDPGTRELQARLPDWEAENEISGHDRPLYGPNLLGLLADMGAMAGDDPRIDRLLDSMLSHQDEEGRFQSFGKPRASGAAGWHTLFCDHHAITEALLRFGRGDDPRVGHAPERMAADLADLTQGRAWPCRPDPSLRFRGPGRRNDFCPLVTLQALRAFSYVPEGDRPSWLPDVARVSLRAWRERGSEKPYMFGHGRQFKRVKWPATWYNSLTVLDAVGRYRELWAGPAVRDADVKAITELAACLIAYNVDSASGTVTPRSCYQGFESYSFGQRKRPSPYATARVLAALAPVAELEDLISAVDVLALASSKGGAGTALAP
jgi:hypothetical protein